MKWTEAEICSHVSRIVLKRRCILLVDRCNWTGHEADVLGVTADGRLIDVEVKVSRADLLSDGKKSKWWHRRYGADWRQENVCRREWPPKVWKHYYVLPADVWRDDLLPALPAVSGILLLRRRRDGFGLATQCRRPAKPCRDAYRLTAAQCLDVARLANLRMWDARLDADRSQPEAPEYLWEMTA